MWANVGCDVKLAQDPRRKVTSISLDVDPYPYMRSWSRRFPWVKRQQKVHEEAEREAKDHWRFDCFISIDYDAILADGDGVAANRHCPGNGVERAAETTAWGAGFRFVYGMGRRWWIRRGRTWSFRRSITVWFTSSSSFTRARRIGPAPSRARPRDMI